MVQLEYLSTLLILMFTKGSVLAHVAAYRTSLSALLSAPDSNEETVLVAPYLVVSVNFFVDF